MHGLVNKAFQSFVSDVFGVPVWHAVLDRAGLWEAVGADGFDPLHRHDLADSQAVLAAAEVEIGRPCDHLLEDLGTWLVSNPRTERLRRLLRFGGLTYTDFLGSLEDLPGRARLAVPDLDLPEMSLRPAGAGRFTLICHACPSGFDHVLRGLLRTLADDYGALVVIEDDCGGRPSRADLQVRGDARLSIEVHDPAHHAGRQFELAEGGGRR